jgi:hypothetical protein
MMLLWDQPIIDERTLNTPDLEVFQGEGDNCRVEKL